MESANLFTSLLPRNSYREMIHLGGYNCAISYSCKQLIA